MNWDIQRRETWLYEANPSLKLIVLVMLFLRCCSFITRTCSSICRSPCSFCFASAPGIQQSCLFGCFCRFS